MLQAVVRAVHQARPVRQVEGLEVEAPVEAVHL